MFYWRELLRAVNLEQQRAILAVSLSKGPGVEVVKELGNLDFVNEIYVCKLD